MFAYRLQFGLVATGDSPSHATLQATYRNRRTCKSSGVVDKMRITSARVKLHKAFRVQQVQQNLDRSSSPDSFGRRAHRQACRLIRLHPIPQSRMASQYSCGCTAIAKRGQGGQRQILTPCKGVEEERTKDRSKRSMRMTIARNG